MSEEMPWRDYDTLYELYVERQLSCNEIGDRLSVSGQTVNSWLKKLGIGVRSQSEATVIAKRKTTLPSFETYSEGYERCETFYRGERSVIMIHRLLAVAEYGFDAVADNHVHHKNGIRWDNRPENIEVLSAEDHMRHHAEERDDWGNEVGLIAQHGAEAVLGPDESYGSKSGARKGEELADGGDE